MARPGVTVRDRGNNGITVLSIAEEFWYAESIPGRAIPVAHVSVAYSTIRVLPVTWFTVLYDYRHCV